jgi:Tol biopolymer transport system component
MSLGLVCGGTLAAQQSSPELLMGEAHHQEEVEGNLDAAIVTYKRIVADSKATRATKAAALIHLGRDYETLGNTIEARRAYEQLARDYADHVQLVGQARARLSTLGDVPSSQSSESGIMLRHIRTDGIDINGGTQLSRDGRFVIGGRGRRDDDSIVIQDLSTGQARVVHRQGGGRAELSWDDQQIAYVAFDEQGLALHVVGIDGSADRVLLRQAGESFIHELAWSPDGRQIALMAPNATGDTFQISLVSTHDGSRTVLKSTGWRPVGLGGYSPDGRFLAYMMNHSPTASDGGVFILAVDGSAEAVIRLGDRKLGKPFWGADGRHIVFDSENEQGDNKSLWSVQVAGGRPVGEPSLLKSDIDLGFGLIASSIDGSFYYLVYNGRYDVFVAEINPQTLEISVPTKPLHSFAGSNLHAVWSADGRSIAFSRSREIAQPGPIVVRSLSDGTERVLPTKVILAPHGALGWFPDNRSLLVPDMHEYPSSNNKLTFMRVDTETGKGTALVDAPYRTTSDMARLSPDSRWLYYVTREVTQAPMATAHGRLIKRDLESGKEIELYRGAEPQALCVSADGRDLAFFAAADEPNQWKLLRVSADGGVPRELARAANVPYLSVAVWTKDGRYILLRTSASPRISAFPVDGSTPRELELNLYAGNDPTIDLSPDGKHLVLTGYQKGAHELWAIQNLLPASQSRR